MSKPPGHIVLGILRVLADSGPMTRVEIARELGLDRALVSPVVSRMLRANSLGPRRIHVAAYRYEEEGHANRYPRAVLALGDKPDAPHPGPAPDAEKQRRYRANRRAKVSSVWEYAMPRRARDAARQAVRQPK